MKKILKLFGKWIIAGMGLVTGVILVYAATTVINSVTTQTINKGDQIGSGWFQEVNDKILSLITNQNNLSGNVQQNSNDFNKIKNIGTQSNPGATCKDILYRNPFSYKQDGVYWIDPDGDGGESPFEVYCDMTTNGGGRMRLILKTRQWGNTYGFNNDPIGNYGLRVIGNGSQQALNNTTTCNGDSQVSLIWENIEGNELNNSIIQAINENLTQGKASFATYDADGTSSRGSIKGCYNNSVVMFSSSNPTGDQEWSSVKNLLGNKVKRIFTLGIYGGNAQASGYNVSLSKYWYFR